MNSFISKTENEALLKDPHYHKIIAVVDSLVTSEFLMSSFRDNCLGSSDIVQSMLSQVGIKSKIVECQATVSGLTEAGDKFFYFVGYDNYNYPGQIDTHTVVITESDNPILIDLSLGRNLPDDHQFVIEQVNKKFVDDSGREIISAIKIKNVEVTYYPKKTPRLPTIHQKNLIQRIIKDQEVEKTMKFIKLMLYCSITLGLTNFVLNMALIIIKMSEKI